MIKYSRYYHIYNRGVRKTPLFLREEDYKLFISRIGEYCILLGISVLAFCIMPNHFHLEISVDVAKNALNRTTDQLVSKFMQKLCTGYGMHFNRSYKTSGHVFQGKYKCKRVPGDDYLIFLSRYIHRNPAEIAGTVKSFRRIAYLRNYKWSSYRYYLGKEYYPTWIDTGRILRRFDQKRSRYQKFVEEDVGNFKRESKYRGVFLKF